MKIPSSEVKKIALFRALQLGDLLCSVPAFRAVRNAYPNAKISLIGLPNSSVLCERFKDYINELIVFPGYPGLPEQKCDPVQVEAFIERMRKEEFDLVLQMQGNGTIVNSLCASFEPRHLAGFYPPKEKPRDLNLFLLYPNFGHESDRHLLLLNHLEINAEKSALEFPITKRDEIQFLKLNLNLQNNPYVCIHPGSRNFLRQWPVSHFAALSDFINQQGYQIIITGTAQEANIVENVAKRMQHSSISLAGKTDLGSLAVLLKNATGLISNCTGISHIAAAIKTPSVIISMDGEPERWGPKNKDLHHTIDWTKNKDYQQVLKAVKMMLSPVQ